MIAGIDEAGRGPVIGPLVLCGVWLTARAEHALATLGVQDSKAFGAGARARARREELARQIRGEASHVALLVAEAAEVDRRVFHGQLNCMEQELARAMLDCGPAARRIVADGARLFGPLRGEYAGFEARNRADSTCVAVAAASIVAKVERDRRVREILSPLEALLGQPITGGGYANKGTEAFLRAYVARFGVLPGELRRSWSWKVLDELGRHRVPGSLHDPVSQLLRSS